MQSINANPSAVAFLRVSSARQRDNTSHDTQEQEIAQYCAENGLELVRVVRMVESAQHSKKRTQYREGLQWVLKNKVHHVIFYIFDRETRNLTDNEINENLIREGKISIHYARERRVFSKDSSDSDFFLRDVQAVSNKQYIRQHRTKVLDAMLTKAKDGWFPCSRPPMGYVHQRSKTADGRERRRGSVIVPNPNQSIVRMVQREFELRAEGLSVAQIRDRIVREGLITAGRIHLYHRSAIEARLRNPFYFGEFDFRGERFKGSHDLIIPGGVLAEVGRSVNMRKAYQRRPEGDRAYFGGGWLRCGVSECGCNIVYDPKRKQLKTSDTTLTFHYWHCTNGKKAHSSMRGLNIREEKIWDGFGEAVDSISITEDLAGAIAKALNETHNKVRSARTREIQNYRDGLNALEREEDSIYGDLKKGLLTEEMYKRQIAAIREQRRTFTNLLEKENASLDGAYLETAQSILELAKDAKSLWMSRSPQERIDFLKLILSNPRLEGASVRYDLKKPFDVLAQMKVSVDWWSLLDHFRTSVITKAA